MSYKGVKYSPRLDTYWASTEEKQATSLSPRPPAFVSVFRRCTQPWPEFIKHSALSPFGGVRGRCASQVVKNPGCPVQVQSLG